MCRSSHRVVLDTGVLVSRVLRPESVPARVVLHAAEHATLLMSEETLRELASVLQRFKFAKYISPPDAEEFVQSMADLAEFVEITAHISVCRDPDDDKFLSLALLGAADAIVTGDKDLLDLSPFEGVAIITPREYLDQRGQQ